MLRIPQCPVGDYSCALAHTLFWCVFHLQGKIEELEENREEAIQKELK